MRRPAALIVACAVLGATGAARADEVPDGKLAVIAGLRNGSGAVSSDVGLGWLWGLEASWQPLDAGQRVGYAITWSMMRGSSSDDASVTGDVATSELTLGVRLRIAPQATPGRYLFLGAGGEALRSNVPLAPDDRRDYWGPF